MDDYLLLKHILDNTTLDEQREVLSWIEESQENKEHYLQLMEVASASSLSEGLAQEMKAQELNHHWHTIRKRAKNSSHRKSGWRVILSYAAAAVIFILIALNLYQYQSSITESQTISYIEPTTPTIHSYYTDNGVKGSIILPDSSVVWLNSGSRITYPEKFSDSKREIQFEGEAYFSVVTNPQWPMTVTTPKGMIIEVKGTTFHLKAYQDDPFEEATLFSGKVNIFKNNKELTTLSPGESFTFRPQKSSIKKIASDTTRCVAWKRGELLFHETPMPEVFRVLERWHGMSFEVIDKAILNYTFTAEFSSESMVQIMELLKFTTPIEYSIKDNLVIISKKKS